MMNVTKFGHACLLLEVDKLTILLDPGVYATVPKLHSLDVILITHEHPDHFDTETLKKILKEHKECEIITHAGVRKVLTSLDIPSTEINEHEVVIRKRVKIESIGKDHASIHPDLPAMTNCGFLIDERFFYPGDSFVVPQKEVSVLALPVAAPWMRLEECIEYAKKVRPEVVFPVHDGMLRPDRMTPTRRIPAMLLEKEGIRFVDMQDGWSNEF